MGWLGYNFFVLVQFNRFCLKRFWRGLFGEGLWSEILKTKYLKRTSLVDWIRNSNKMVKMGLCDGKVSFTIILGWVDGFLENLEEEFWPKLV